MSFLKLYIALSASAAVGACATVALCGYFFQVPGLRNWGKATEMALVHLPINGPGPATARRRRYFRRPWREPEKQRNLALGHRP